jgi:hypothetical protein
MNKKAKFIIRVLLTAISFSLTAYSQEIKWGVCIFSESLQLQTGSYTLNAGASSLGGISSNATYTLIAGRSTLSQPPILNLNLTVTKITSCLVALRWTDIATETDYVLQRNNATLTTLLANTTSYEDTRLKANTRYVYDLYARDATQTVIAVGSLIVTTPPSPGVFIPYHNLFHPLKGEKVSVYYELDKASRVKIKFYDLLGELVKELVNEDKVAGKYWIEWDGKDDSNKTCPAGVYIIQIQAGDFKDAKKIILVK